MLFNSWQFLLFFPVVILAYFAMPPRWRNYWLLIASYYFYMGWNAKYALLLLFSTTVTFISGRVLSITPLNTAGRKTVVVLSLALNFSVLFFFKYFDFVVNSIDEVLMRFGINADLPHLDLLLPVGISFYIFQAFSYTMDVYRGAIPAEKNFFKYALFVSFFPQLVAGPIERSTNLLPQFDEIHQFEPRRVTRGTQLMLWGYFEKIAIADTIAPIVDNVYSTWETKTGIQIAVATILFAFQIYCDFGGYSHIAIGAAEVLGFRLMQNFRQPYLATDVKDFWRRWHISLSTWFRDYLYFPLGGNKKGLLRQKINVMIVFLVSGFWHGASWTYVLWGGLNGLLQVLKKSRETSMGKARRLVNIILTFVLIDVTWLFFRAETVGQALGMLKRLAVLPSDWSASSLLGALGSKYDLMWIFMVLAMLLVCDILHERKVSIRDELEKCPAILRWCTMLAACELIFMRVVAQFGQPVTAFLYFQF